MYTRNIQRHLPGKRSPFAGIRVSVMGDAREQPDNCAACGRELAPQGSDRDPCPDCGSTTRIVSASVELIGESSLQADLQVIKAEGIESTAQVGQPTVTQATPDTDYENDLLLFQVERVGRSSFTGLCDSDSHQPFAVAGRSAQEVKKALLEHFQQEHGG